MDDRLQQSWRQERSACSAYSALILLLAVGVVGCRPEAPQAKDSQTPSIVATNRPTMPIVQPGCTMECCLLGEWAAPVPTPAFKEASGTDTAFVLARDDSITALIQHMRTTAPGLVVPTKDLRVKVTQPGDAAFSTLSVPAGDTIYITGFSAEATDVSFWYRGQTYAAAGEFQVFGVRSATSQWPYDVLSVPAVEWWVKVRNRKGAEGWVLNANYFGGAGRCR